MLELLKMCADNDIVKGVIVGSVCTIAGALIFKELSKTSNSKFDKEAFEEFFKEYQKYEKATKAA